MNRADLRAALSHPNVAAFLRVIRQGETSQAEDAYRMQFSGKMFEAPPWEHPREKVTTGRWTSTAAGAYQFLERTWDGLADKWGFPDFSPGCQDEAAVALIHGRGALDDVLGGRLEEALGKCNREWASLPGSPYGQPTMTLDEARDLYAHWGGALADPLATEHYGDTVTESKIQPIPSADEQEAHMAPLIIPLLTALGPELLKLIPQFGSLLGSGSEVQVRNVKLAEAAVSAVVSATGSKNLQDAIETMQREPEKAKAAQVAAAEVLQLVEVGGGIKAAREASAAQSGDWRKLIFSLPFVGIILFTPAIWAVVAASVFKAPWLLEMDPQLRGTVIGFVMGTLAGSICGYVFGSSMTKAPAQPFTAR